MRKNIHKKKKLLLIIAVILGLIFGLLIIPQIKDGLFPGKKSDAPIIATPSQSPQLSSEEVLDTSNWVEYKSDEYKIAFKYPGKFVTNVFNESEQTINLFSGITFGRMKMPNRTLYEADFAQLGYTFDLFIDNRRTLKEALEETDIYKDRPGYSKKEIKFHGLNAYQYEGVGLDSYQTRVFFERNKVVYLFKLSRFVQDGPLITEGEQVFKKVLDSVTFPK